MQEKIIIIAIAACLNLMENLKDILEFKVKIIRFRYLILVFAPKLTYCKSIVILTALL
jgi:hypothetical protein